MLYPLTGEQRFSSLLSFQNNTRNEITITVESQAHLDFGLSYPITYELHLPHNSQNLNAYRKYNSSQSWNLIDKKTNDDFFNGIEAARFDYDQNKAYISVLLLLELVEAKFAPSTVILLYLGDNPRITTLFPSPPSLLMDTPGTLETASAALASGSS